MVLLLYIGFCTYVFVNDHLDKHCIWPLIFILIIITIRILGLSINLYKQTKKCNIYNGFSPLFLSPVKDAISNAETASSKIPTKDPSHPPLNSSGEESNQEDLEAEGVSTDEESKVR